MRTFTVTRAGDETGVPGTGVVIEGVVFSDGEVVARWVSARSPGRSTTIWDSLGAFIAVHVVPHPSNRTKIVFSDGVVMKFGTSAKKKRDKRGKPEMPPVDGNSGHFHSDPDNQTACIAGECPGF